MKINSSGKLYEMKKEIAKLKQDLATSNEAAKIAYIQANVYPTERNYVL